MAAINEALETGEHLSENEENYEYQLKNVQETGYKLSDVPEPLKTAELCLAAVKSYGHVLEFVPDTLKTTELCLEAVKSDGEALAFVPDALKTEEICLTAIQKLLFIAIHSRSLKNNIHLFSCGSK